MPKHPLTAPNLLSLIDSGADSIIRDVVGERTEEYRTAEQQAQAFKDAGYQGAAGASITAWSSAKAWTNQQAADDILTTAVLWRGAQAVIRTARLAHKERARNGEDTSAVLASWQAFVSTIRTQLGIA